MTARKILVVDDEPNLCRLYKQALAEDGYEVRTASNARQALEDVETFAPDLVVMDIRMPGMDGIEAMGRILNRKQDMPVVLNSAYCSYKDNFCTWPASAYVVKSSDLSELKTTIRNLIMRPEGRDAPAAKTSGAGPMKPALCESEGGSCHAEIQHVRRDVRPGP